MTDKDRRIQDLRRENEGLREELRLAVEACRICRLCKHMDEDCSPSGTQCRPEYKETKWRK